MSNNTNSEIDFIEVTAKRGDARAQCELGRLLIEGEGVVKDLKKAERWLRLAAEQGNIEAQYRLAGMFNKDGGSAEDKKEARKWYEKAAEEGHAESQLFLGMMYLHGDGIEPDLIKSYAWFSLAEDSGREMFQGMADKVAGEKMSGDEIDAAKKEAAQWRQKKAAELDALKADAEKGDTKAQYELGNRHLDGRGVEKSIEKGRDLIKSAAEGGYADAQNLVGSELLDAVKLIKLVADRQGHVKVPGLLDASIKAIKEADSKPDFRMKNDLGIMLLEGADVTNAKAIDQKMKEAIGWLEKAAEQGNHYAQFNLARIKTT